MDTDLELESTNTREPIRDSLGRLIRTALARIMCFGPLVLIAVYCVTWEDTQPSQERMLATEWLLAATQRGDLREVEAALSAGADVNFRDDMGNTPLIVAACARHPDVARLLLRRGANVHVSNPGRDPPLCAAARSGALALARDLLFAGADPNTPGDANCTPLFHCANSDTVDAPEVAAELIRAGADVYRVNGEGTTPLGAALSSGNLRVAQVLMRAGGSQAWASRWRH